MRKSTKYSFVLLIVKVFAIPGPTKDGCQALAQTHSNGRAILFIEIVVPSGSTYDQLLSIISHFLSHSSDLPPFFFFR